MKIEPIESVKIRLDYRTSDARRVSNWDSNTSTRTTPDRTLIDAARELARIAEIAGCGRDLEAAVVEARQRVKDWRKANGDV
jgi:transcription initiation factor TFIIIB Brf1 subunit/transcription initiation factor TFIIB